jgi:hypothetical protein
MVSTVDFKVDSSFKYLSSWAVIYSIPAGSPSFLPSSLYTFLIMLRISSIANLMLSELADLWLTACITSLKSIGFFISFLTAGIWSILSVYKEELTSAMSAEAFSWLSCHFR